MDRFKETAEAIGRMRVKNAPDEEVYAFLKTSPAAKFVADAETLGYTPSQIINRVGGVYIDKAMRESQAGQDALRQMAKQRAMGVKDTDILRQAAQSPLKDQIKREFFSELTGAPISPELVVDSVGGADMEVAARDLPIHELRKNRGQYLLVQAGKAFNDMGRKVKGLVTGREEPNPNAESDAMLDEAMRGTMQGYYVNKYGKLTQEDVNALAAELLRKK